jgi:hypothetical protein
MNKIFNKNKLIPYFIIALISLISLIPFFSMNLSFCNEARIHIARIVSVKQIISEGVFPPFISYKHMCGFGYALNIFYGALTTYIPIIISYITKSEIIALKVYTLLVVALSGFTMFNFVKYIVKDDKKSSLIALIAAIIYILAPYKLANIYSRNAVGEYTAFIFIPMVFQGLYSLLNSKKDGKEYYIAIGAIGLILSHTITTIYVAVFSVIYIIINFKKIKNLNVWKKIFINILIILSITAFYTVPLLEHKLYGDYCIYDNAEMGATGENVQATTVGLKEWLSSEFSNNEINLSLGIIMIWGLLLTCVTYKKSKDKEEYTTFGLLAIIALFMSSKLFPWFAMPRFLNIIQFAWRLSGFFIFFASYICAVNIVQFSSRIKDKHNVLAITCIVLSCIFTVISTMNYWDTLNMKEETDFENQIKNASKIGPYSINREYLPIKSLENLKYIQDREDKTYVVSGEAIILNENKEKLHDVMDVTEVKDATLELPYIYYHGYTVAINGKKVDVHESDKGFIEININEPGKIEVAYTGTITEKCGMIISLVSAIICVCIYLFKRRVYETKE